MRCVATSKKTLLAMARWPGINGQLAKM